MENIATETSPVDDGFATGHETAPSPSGRPAHTLASIAVMALLAAAALYGVIWSVQPDSRVVQTWDFSEVDYATTPWLFPRVKKEQEGPGVTFLALETGPGPELFMELDPATVRQVRVTAEILRVPQETPVPFALEWYWARNEDITPGGWPYAVERGTAFQVRNRHTPNVHTAVVSRHPQWTGNITQAFIGLKFPPDEPGPFLVRILRIEFLE